MKTKIISTLVIAMLILIMIVPTIFAFTPGDVNPNITGPGSNSVKSLGNQITGIIQIVGTIVSVAMLIVLGIKYMMGSAEEKAEYKKTLFPYLIGAVLIFAASNLAKIIYDWASTVK